MKLFEPVMAFIVLVFLFIFGAVVIRVTSPTPEHPPDVVCVTDTLLNRMAPGDTLTVTACGPGESTNP